VVRRTDLEFSKDKRNLVNLPEMELQFSLACSLHRLLYRRLIYFNRQSLRAEGSGVQSLAGGFLHSRPDLARDPPILLYNEYQCSFFQIKRRRRSVDHQPPPRTDIKNYWTDISSPHLCLHHMLQTGCLRMNMFTP